MGKMGSADNIYGISENKKQRSFMGFGAERESSDTGFRHSGYYHRYFKGYTEIRREKPNGKYAIERIYTAPWKVQAVDRRAYFLIRLAYVLLALLSCAVYLYVMARPLPGNSCVYVAIPGLPAVAALVLLCAAVLSYIARPRRMTLWDHSTGTGRLKFAALLSAGLQGATVLTKLVFALLNPGWAVPELLNALGVLLSAAASFGIFLIERQIKYRDERNDTKLPQGEKHEIL